MREHFREMRLLYLHVASTFIMKTFVLDFIQCRTFLTVLNRVRNAQSVFIPESVFYTQSVMLSPPRFIPESVFYTQSVVCSPQSIFYTDRHSGTRSWMFNTSNESHVNYLHIRYLLQGLAGRTLLSFENIANQRSTNLRSKIPLTTTLNDLDC